jgi:transcriptional regulator with XRE-family HTH domain
MSDYSKKQLGERIRRARLEANLKQDELAERIGVSQGVISNVETGVSTIDVPDLPKWAEALDKPIMYFYLDESMHLEARATAVLSMFPEERMEFVLQMLETLALTMRERDDI